MYHVLRYNGTYHIVIFQEYGFGMIWYDPFRLEYVLVLSYQGRGYTKTARCLEEIEEFLDDLTGEKP